MFKGKRKISIPHFYCMEYSEGKRTMTIDIDFRDTQLFLSKSLIKCWNSPYESDAISDEKRDEIYEYIKDFLVKKFGQEKIVEEV